DIDLRNDGVLNNVPMFQWDPFIQKNCDAFEKWKKTNTITKYNGDDTELENKNIIGLYSSALYGYNNSLPIAVAANANHYEIGYEGFEEYTTTTNLNSLGMYENGHINFAKTSGTYAYEINRR